MRAPLNEMLPVTRGVSILMRGVAVIAVSRLTTGAAAEGWPGVVGEGVAPGCGVVEPGVAEPGVAGVDDLASSVWAWVCARCRSICGTL